MEQVVELAEKTRKQMHEVTSHFAHLKEIRSRNTDPWFHPTSIADAFSKKFNDTEEATKLYNTHTAILDAKLTSINHVIGLIVFKSGAE